MGAADDLDEGRFPRSVFADESVDLAGAQLEGNALERVPRRRRLC